MNYTRKYNKENGIRNRLTTVQPSTEEKIALQIIKQNKEIINPMRKLKLQVQISVDGYVAGPNGEEDWIVRGSDEKLWQLINELADSSDTLLLGRKMAKGFVPHFEAFETDSPKITFAWKMVNIPKIIFTKTLDKPFGKNTSLCKRKSGRRNCKTEKSKRQRHFGLRRCWFCFFPDCRRTH